MYDKRSQRSDPPLTEPDGVQCPTPGGRPPLTPLRSFYRADITRFSALDPGIAGWGPGLRLVGTETTRSRTPYGRVATRPEHRRHHG